MGPGAVRLPCAHAHQLIPEYQYHMSSASPFLPSQLPLSLTQIISLQSIHYLTLSLLLPSLLSHLTHPALLAYSGGPSTVSHILDWREMASRPTVSSSAFPGLSEGWRTLRGAWAGGKQVGVLEGEEDGIGSGQKGVTGVEEEEEEVWDFGVDDKRGWVVGFTWLIASGIEWVQTLSNRMSRC